MIRSLLALLAASILAATLAACGDSAKTTTSTSDIARAETTASTQSIPSTDLKDSSGGYLKYDGDTDPDDEPAGDKPSTENDDQHLLKEYGVKPSSAEMQAMATSVKNYFAAAAQENAARACSLIAASLAAGLATSSGSSGNNTTCTNAMTTMLAQQHAQLATDEVATMKLITARVKRGLALAVLGFRRQPESEMLLQHEGKTWRIDALTPSEMP